MSVVEAGIPVSAAQADACPLCSSHDRTTANAVRPADKRDIAFPWFVAVTAAVVIASVGVGPDRFFGLGAVTGIAAGALLAMQAVRGAVRVRNTAHAQAMRDLNEDADQRVAMVIKQFEWAVNDVVKLKREHERAQVTADLLVVQGRARERHIRKIERDLSEAKERLVTMRSAGASADSDPAAAPTTDDAVKAWWGLHTSEGSSRLELECDMSYRPTRIRITDRFGEVKVKSMTAMHSGEGSLSFAIGEPPADLIAALETGREHGYRFEALCQYEWRPMKLVDTGRRTKLVQDRSGRLFRVNDADAIARMTTFNPFDLTSDNAQLTLN